MIQIGAVMTREVPAEWDDELRRISPRSSAHSYLQFRWLAERWVLYQMQPAWAIPHGLRRMLEDMPPRLMPAGRAFARSLFVDDWAHEVYRTERVFPRPFWVIQGHGGGVPAGYSEAETDILKALGEPTEPPPVGALCYAPFDGRVVEQILMRDKLLQAHMQLDALIQEGKLLSTYRDELLAAAEGYRRTFLDWFKTMLAPSVEFLTWYTRRSESDRELRTATRAEMRAARECEDTFMETGYAPTVTDAA